MSFGQLAIEQTACQLKCNNLFRFGLNVKQSVDFAVLFGYVPILATGGPNGSF